MPQSLHCILVIARRVIRNFMISNRRLRRSTRQLHPRRPRGRQWGREEPLWTMSYQTSSKRSPPFCLLIGQKNKKVFWHQSEARTAATVWNWSGKTLSPGALLAVLHFSSCHIFPPVQPFPRPHYPPLGLRGCSQVRLL